MPIKPERQGFYPIDWKQLSKEIRFNRAKGRCEQCGRPHGQVISHLGDVRQVLMDCEPLKVYDDDLRIEQK